jgi:hypothetical protein
LNSRQLQTENRRPFVKEVAFDPAQLGAARNPSIRTHRTVFANADGPFGKRTERPTIQAVAPRTGVPLQDASELSFQRTSIDFTLRFGLNILWQILNQRIKHIIHACEPEVLVEL